MPIGIPHPADRWDGNDPMLMPAPQRSTDDEEAGFYFVYPQHPDATDDENPWGSPNKPRLTLPYVASFPAGTVIEVKGRVPYSGNGQWLVNCAGTASNPVFIRGVSKIDRPYIEWSPYLSGGYVIVENLDLSQSKTGGRNAGSLVMRPLGGSHLHHCCIRNNYGRGNGIAKGGAASLISCSGEENNRYNDFVFCFNDFADYGDSVLTVQNDFHCFHPQSNVDYVWVLFNKSARFGGDSIQIGTATIPSSYYGEYCFVGGNDFSEDGENGVDIKKFRKVVITSNNIHDYDPETSVDHVGSAIVIHNECEDVWFLNNKIRNAGNGFVGTGHHRVRIIGNTFENFKRYSGEPSVPESGYVNGTVLTLRANNDCAFLNNTARNYQRGLNIQAGADFFLANNILENRWEEVEYDVRFPNSNKLLRYSMLDSICINNTTYPNQSANGSTEYDDIANFPNTTNGFHADPLLEDSDEITDFSIADTSPCVDAGVDISSYLTEFNLIFGTEITADQWLNVIEQGAGKDIGAFETGGALIAAQPKPVTNLYIESGGDPIVRWRGGSLNTTDYKVYRSDDRGLSYSLVGTTSDEYYTDATALPSTNYTYRVDSSNANGDFPSSDARLLSMIVTPLANMDDLTVGANEYLTTRSLVRGNKGVGDISIDSITYTNDGYASNKLATITGIDQGTLYKPIVENESFTVAFSTTNTGNVDFYIGGTCYGSDAKIVVTDGLSTITNLNISEGYSQDCYKVQVTLDDPEKNVIVRTDQTCVGVSGFYIPLIAVS